MYEIIFFAFRTGFRGGGSLLFRLSTSNEIMDEKGRGDVRVAPQGDRFCGHVSGIGHRLSVQMIKSFDFEIQFH